MFAKKIWGGGASAPLAPTPPYYTLAMQPRLPRAVRTQHDPEWLYPPEVEWNQVKVPHADNMGGELHKNLKVKWINPQILNLPTNLGMYP